MNFRNLTVPVWELSIDVAALNVSVVDSLVGVAEAEDGITVGIDTPFVKCIAEEACTLTITNNTDRTISVDGTAVEAGNNTTVSLTAGTPQLVTIL